jgi:hypothetical protein
MTVDVCTILFLGSYWLVEQTLVQASKHAKDTEINMNGQVTNIN